MQRAELTIEPALPKLESTAKPLLERIAQEDTVAGFTTLEAGKRDA